MNPNRANLSFSLKVLLLLSLLVVEGGHQKATPSTTRDESRGNFVRSELVRDTVFVQVSQQK